MLRARHARRHGLDPIAAEVLVAPSPFAAPVVVFGALAPATRATQRALPAPHPDHQDGSRAQRGIVHRHVLDDHALDVQQSFESALQPRRFPRLYFLVEKQTYRKRPSHIGIQRLTDEPPPTKTTQEPDLNCSLHGGIIPVSVPPEVPLREFPYNAVVELVNPGADTVSRKTYTGADADWYVKAEDIVLKNAGNPRNHTPQGQPKK